MFGMLLGTLQKFKKDEEKHTFKDQVRFSFISYPES